MGLISILTRKSIADVTRRKGRSLLVVLGIFIGVLGLTAVNIANDTFGQQFLSIVAPSDVPNATFFAASPSPATLTALQQVPNVATVEVRTQLRAGWKLASGETASIDLDGYANWQPTTLNTFQLTKGRWPGQGEIVMASRDHFIQPVALGDTVTITTADGRTVSLRVVGLAYTIEQTNAQAIGYMNADALRQIAPAATGSPPALAHDTPPAFFSTEILLKTQNQSYASVQATFATLTHLLKTSHVQVFTSRFFATANQQDERLAISGLLNILLILASIALLLVCVLILNTVNTVLTEQMKIIGTMKTLGGTRWQIIRSYQLSIGWYALIGTALGLGVGLILFSQVAAIVARQAQLDLPPFQVAPWVILTSVAVGLLVPMCSALGPLWIGTGITVREALASYGVQHGKRASAHAWGRRLHWVPQTVWLGLRGVARRPGRAVLTVLALTLASAVFLAIQITNQSIAAAIAHNNTFLTYDMWVDLSQNPALFQRLRAQIQALPNVEQTSLSADRTFVMTSGGELEIFGLPGSPQVYQPQLVAGRWLQAQDRGGMVVNDVAAQQLHLSVGATITFRLETPQTPVVHWQIVGIVHELAATSGTASSNVQLGVAFTTLNTFHTLPNLPPSNRAGLWIFLHNHSPQALQRLRSQVVRIQQQAGIPVDLSTPALDQAAQFDPTVIVYVLFDTVAILIALVGMLSLTNTLAASVLERRAEIGILRSLGASGWRIGFVFWLEGLCLSLIAWAIGLLIGPVGGAVILQKVGEFAQRFDLVLSPGTILMTLLFVFAISIISSFGPTLFASHLRLREILQYE
jgi:putative ABC transport system permease protein